MNCVARILVFAFSLNIFWMTLTPALAQQPYPNKPIKLIVTYPPGGGNDIIARIFANKMSETMGQPVIVENRSGASGTIGTNVAAKASADGYTIVLVSPPFVMAPSLYSALPYDTQKDLTPITVIGSVPNLLVVHPSLPVKNVTELIKLAQTKPISAATLGEATTQHLAAALFNSMTKSEILLVPYKGSAPGVSDLLAGHVQMMFNAMPSTLPYVTSGKLRALGVTGSKRSSMAPELPTISESLPGYEIVTWYGLLAPTGTPAPIIARLNSEILKISAMPDVRKKLLEMGMDIEVSSPSAFGARISLEIIKWKELGKQIGIQPSSPQ